MNRFREQSVSAALFCFRLHIAHLQSQIRCRCKIAVLQEVKIAVVSARAPLLFFLTLFSVFLFSVPRPTVSLCLVLSSFSVIYLSIFGITHFHIINHINFSGIFGILSLRHLISQLYGIYTSKANKQGKTVFGTMLRLLRFIYIFELLPS
ncbi:unknown [Clostridium sp. CAG:413]|nr:unknown [Clostridium sp. CAG:413]